MIRMLFAAATVAFALPLPAAAQGVAPRLQGRRGGPPPDSVQRNRAMLEQQLQQRLAQVMKNQLGATDAQMARVMEINATYSARRRALLQQEREIRMSLRQEINGADSTRHAQVAELLDRMLRAQRQRLEILEQEQRDLATVLTPLQRASYFGLEEQLRQRIEGMRGQGGRAGPGIRPPGDSLAPRLGGRGVRRPPPPG